MGFKDKSLERKECAAITWKLVDAADKDYVQCSREGPECRLEGLLISVAVPLCEEHQEYFERKGAKVVILQYERAPANKT